MASQQNEMQIVAAASFIVMNQVLNKKKKKERRWWITRLHQRRNVASLLRDLRFQESSGQFKNFVRMSSADFEKLICLIGPKVAKKNTKFRAAIPVDERLAITLRFLATGDSYSSLDYLTGVSKQSISFIVMDVCRALIQVLKSYIELPSTPEEWTAVAADFEKKWQFPHCIGAMDGKHVEIECPPNSVSDFINYKGFFSIVLLALVDANYKFLFVDIGCQGRISDGGVFKHTKLHALLNSKKLGLPPVTSLEDSNFMAPYVIVADDAFALHENIMKPYSHQSSEIEKKIFNYRLCRARRVVENVFGICSSTFRVLRKPILLHPEKAAIVTMTVTLLHNFLRASESSNRSYCPPGTFDDDVNGECVPGLWRKHGDGSLLSLQNVPRRAKDQAKEVRGIFTQYFNSSGSVPWQHKHI
ncbi:unnamed protein product [Larinioides sclopetarius]|uniref:DDE Tnp4 domain-containing protein n=1 Tax=Larinioides sclopetarius TaxID=280406 RepID=A0AAV1Z7S8_9ARAC